MMSPLFLFLAVVALLSGTTTANFSYLGCFSDSLTSPALTRLLLSSNNGQSIGVQQCAQLAETAGLSYFALQQQGALCYGSSSFTAATQYGLATTCQPCLNNLIGSVNITQTCGSSLINSLYVIVGATVTPVFPPSSASYYTRNVHAALNSLYVLSSAYPYIALTLFGNATASPTSSSSTNATSIGSYLDYYYSNVTNTATLFYVGGSPCLSSSSSVPLLRSVSVQLICSYTSSLPRMSSVALDSPQVCADTIVVNTPTLCATAGVSLVNQYSDSACSVPTGYNTMALTPGYCGYATFGGATVMCTNTSDPISSFTLNFYFSHPCLSLFSTTTGISGTCVPLGSYYYFVQCDAAAALSGLIAVPATAAPVIPVGTTPAPPITTAPAVTTTPPPTTRAPPIVAGNPNYSYLGCYNLPFQFRQQSSNANGISTLACAQLASQAFSSQSSYFALSGSGTACYVASAAQAQYTVSYVTQLGASTQCAATTLCLNGEAPGTCGATSTFGAASVFVLTAAVQPTFPILSSYNNFFNGLSLYYTNPALTVYGVTFFSSASQKFGTVTDSTGQYFDYADIASSNYALISSTSNASLFFVGGTPCGSSSSLQRSAVVQLSCSNGGVTSGPTTLVSVQEGPTCFYTYNVTSPQACTSNVNLLALLASAANTLLTIILIIVGVIVGIIVLIIVCCVLCCVYGSKRASGGTAVTYQMQVPSGQQQGMPQHAVGVPINTEMTNPVYGR